MSAADDALDVARFCWPEPSWKESWHKCVILHLGESRPNWFDFEDANDIAAAERVLVERGLGEQYGAELWAEVDGSIQMDSDGREWPCIIWEDIALIATAPLDARLRAMARVVREQQPKEKA